jgi:hypothetical protein
MYHYTTIFISAKFIYRQYLELLSLILSASRIVLIASVLYLVIFFALVSGIINAILEGSLTPQGTFIIPSRSAQTLGETIVTTMILFMGMVGAYLLYRSGQALTTKSQETLLAAGFGVLFISLTLGLMLVNIKV